MGKKYLDLSGEGILPRRGVPSWQRKGIAGSCATSASSARVLRREFVFRQHRTSRCPSRLRGTGSFPGRAPRWQRASWGARGWCRSRWDPAVAPLLPSAVPLHAEVCGNGAEWGRVSRQGSCLGRLSAVLGTAWVGNAPGGFRGHLEAGGGEGEAKGDVFPWPVVFRMRWSICAGKNFTGYGERCGAKTLLVSAGLFTLNLRGELC